MTLKIYYFCSSHWDREWYQPFQHFRIYLLKMADELFEVLEQDEEFKIFNFDGQAIVLDDILEIHPEWRKRIDNLVRCGKLNIGPWYVQPDEFLVSGEALIRNLQLGHLKAIEYGGKAWTVGYLCDIFGHIAQMPQILNGFDINSAIIWRGAPPDCQNCFRWIAPDGSECLAVKLPEKQGYGDFAGSVTGLWNFELSEEKFKSLAFNYIEEQRQNTSLPMVILMDGVDHAPVHSAVPQYIQYLKELYPEAEIDFADFTEVEAELKTHESFLTRVSGELNFTTRETGGFMNLITHTLSSYYPLKQANDDCQNTLELQISPLMVYAGLNGMYLDNKLLGHAWKLLLSNQAHDSICGCSIDQVHKDMEYRFDQVKSIGEALLFEFMVHDRNAVSGYDIRRECLHISGGEPDIEYSNEHGTLLVRLFNPLPYDYEQVHDFEIVFPVDYEMTYAEPFGYEFINAFMLEDEQHNPVEYNITSIKHNVIRRFYRFDARSYDVYHVSARLQLKALGWTTLTVLPSEKPVRNFASQLTGRNSAENSVLCLEVNADGTLNITDKRSGRKYSGLNTFATDGEIGDGWNHVSPKGNVLAMSTSTIGSISLIEDSPSRTRFEIAHKMVLPKELRFDGTLQEKYHGINRSLETAELKIVTRVTIDENSPLVQFETEIDNSIKDYRLRMIIPTGIEGDYFAHQAFLFLVRQTGRSSGTQTEGWKEPEQLEKNFGDIVGKWDKQGGVAFLSGGGLHEVGTPVYDNGEIWITLFRAFRRTVATNGEKRGQLQRKMIFKYALYFCDENDYGSYGVLYRQLQQYRTPVINYTLDAPEHFVSEESGILSIDSNDVCMSIIKSPETMYSNAVIVRFVNYASNASQAKINIEKDYELTGCEKISLKEEYIKTPEFHKNGIELEFAPHEIITLKFNIVIKTKGIDK